MEESVLFWRGSAVKILCTAGLAFLWKRNIMLLINQLLNRFDPGNHNGNQNPKNPYESKGESQTR
jgi:hypothetical protein